MRLSSIVCCCRVSSSFPCAMSFLSPNVLILMWFRVVALLFQSNVPRSLRQNLVKKRTNTPTNFFCKTKYPIIQLILSSPPFDKTKYPKPKMILSSPSLYQNFVNKRPNTSTDTLFLSFVN
ncbi:hypothetical protein QBC38DRAFT_46545, partial [Podospora fimiseda]